jgi:hypothetical protein
VGVLAHLTVWWGYLGPFVHVLPKRTYLKMSVRIRSFRYSLKSAKVYKTKTFEMADEGDLNDGNFVNLRCSDPAPTGKHPALTQFLYIEAE